MREVTTKPGSSRWTRRLGVMKAGERSRAKAQVARAMRWLRQAGYADPMAFTRRARDEVSPSVARVSVKRGGASYQVPHPRSRDRGRFLGRQWILQGARKRAAKGISFDRALARELDAIGQDLGWIRGEVSPRGSEASATKGVASHAMAQKRAVHRTAKANRVFAHRRWR